MKKTIRPWIFGVLAMALGGGAQAAEPAVLLSDDYRAMTPGMISGGVIGARTEYHYLSVMAPKGNWGVGAFRTDASQRAWRLIEENGERLMWQSYTESERERPYTHPLLVAGDELWTDYTVAVRFAPESDQYQSGVVFRYHTNRVYYFAGVVGQKAVLKKINNGVAFRKMDETVLAERPLTWKPGEFLALKVTVEGDKLTADFGRGVKLEARDAAFKQGKIGFLSDVPTKFGKVTVTCSSAAKAAFEQARQARADEEARFQAENPKMVLWKKIYTPGFGAGRNLRFGDLDGDGKIDILVVQQNPRGPNDGYSEVGCMTALTLDGKRLWQNGIQDSWHDQLTNDVGVQIHDIDGDGKNEVIYCRDQEIVVADGATGLTKYKAPTPLAPPAPNGRPSRFPRILGDCLYFCDFRGLGAARDLIVKDRYRNIWAYTDKLEPLWHLALNTGHYPYAFDVDGDGKDELAIGYSLVDHDGKIIWNLENQLADDHADGVAILSFKEGAPPRWLCVASDDGFIEADLKGNILTHQQLGHVQNPTVAKLRPDLPGLQTVTVNFWGNQGIVSFFDADGKKYYDYEPAHHGSMMLPLNWKGDGQEYWILSPNSEEGGAYDGWGRRALRFPADGHPDLCVAALDLTGDCRDEIVVWDAWEIWIYTQADNPKPGKLYKPKRNPQYNNSNYQANVSLPGWSE
jgi:rhamnogalacturonan endolyase